MENEGEHSDPPQVPVDRDLQSQLFVGDWVIAAFIRLRQLLRHGEPVVVAR